MRINQYVAAATGLSRRQADSAIESGRVTVDGHPATLGETVGEGADVLLDDRPVRPPQAHRYVILNKPEGYVTSRAQQGSDPTIYDLLPPELHRLRPAGRLDRDSSGLIVLSDDGQFIHRLTHPSFDKSKVYELTLAVPLAQADRRRLDRGIKLEDGISRVEVRAVKGKQVTVALSEGRNRQLRRTFGALGYTIERLHRNSMGDIEIGGLAPGKWQDFRP
ncbi:MAG: rluB [Candidatus Saccharibacteria bacterium]|jgi:23S rRNA pseudouridine2605 synthase|nr:rluB [Candidatus Saccharibacteria bacterium]